MSLLNLDNYSQKDINELVQKALKIKNKEMIIDYKQKKIIGLLFFENSTRTHYSFDVAAKRSGIQVVDFVLATSSINKGESFIDTIRTFESFDLDALVIRDQKDNYYDELKEIDVPIINGGDGSGSHPTQALLDLMTIYEQFGKFEGLKVAIIGDIKHSRVARTNYYIMKKLKMDVKLVADDNFRLDYGEYITMDEAVKTSDICMLLRVQLERHALDYPLDEYNKRYGLNKERLQQIKSDAIIMHPAPFNIDIEITKEVLEDERCKIFEQSRNGVYMRMAVLDNELK